MEILPKDPPVWGNMLFSSGNYLEMENLCGNFSLLEDFGTLAMGRIQNCLGFHSMGLVCVFGVHWYCKVSMVLLWYILEVISVYYNFPVHPLFHF